MTKRTIISVLILAGTFGAFAQGFVNLDFESANLSGYGAGSVPTASAIPGWTAYLGGTNLANINYDLNHYNGTEVCLVGSANLQGNYYVLLQGAIFNDVNEAASIGQTGTIPATAGSLIWWAASGPFSLSFNGQTLPYSAIGSGTGYAIFAANISTFAGETGELLFTSTGYPGAPGCIIDNIQFSSSPVPEPGVLALFALGGGALLCHRRKSAALAHPLPSYKYRWNPANTLPISSGLPKSATASAMES